MNVHQKNKLEMLGTVAKFFEDEKDSLAAIPAVAPVFGEIKNIHKEIILNEKIVNEGTKVKVISKDNSQTELIRATLVVAGALYAYAVDKGDTELMLFADINSKSFVKKRDSEIPGFVEDIITKADGLSSELLPFGISKEKRADARAKLNDYIAKFGSVASGKTTKKAAGETVALLFNKADRKVKILDKLMLNIKSVNPELHSKYSAARVIYDKVSSHKNTNTVTAPVDNNNSGA